MSAREKILNAIAANQPALVPLPIMERNVVIDYENPCSQFKIILESIGGKVEFVEDLLALKEKINTDKKSGKLIINTITSIADPNEPEIPLTVFELEKLERVYLEGSIAVAENGAVWIYESQMKNRLLPFICQHLVVVVKKEDIVHTLHQAYDKINVAREGFGIFIAGPSKTADIEQSLVIGAHGARSTTVYVVG